MANSPKKMTDPTEAALSAIQEALNVHEEDEQATSHGAAPDLFSAPGEEPQQVVEAPVDAEQPGLIVVSTMAASATAGEKRG